jgi:hypothetical protein
MAYWGIALVLGTNYNLPVDDEREKLPYENVQKALALSAKRSAQRARLDCVAFREVIFSGRLVSEG